MNAFPMGPALWAAKYLEIPFVDPGFSLQGCHCWGLVYLIFKQELNIELPKHSEYSAAQAKGSARMISQQKFLPPWIPVAGFWKPYDVVVMWYHGYEGRERLGKIEGHVGVATSPGHVLHIEKGIESINMPVDHPRIKNRIVGAYRHEALVR